MRLRAIALLLLLADAVTDRVLPFVEAVPEHLDKTEWAYLCLGCGGNHLPPFCEEKPVTDDRYLTLAREIHVAMAWGKNHEGEWPPVNCDGCAAIARALTQAHNDALDSVHGLLDEQYQEWKKSPNRAGNPDYYGGGLDAVVEVKKRLSDRALRREGEK